MKTVEVDVTVRNIRLSLAAVRGDTSESLDSPCHRRAAPFYLVFEQERRGD